MARLIKRSNENYPPEDSSHVKRQYEDENALDWFPRKRPRPTDPLVHHGRHFGRTIHAMCNMMVLLSNGLQYLADLDDPDHAGISENNLSTEKRREQKIFQKLLQLIPNLESRLLEVTEEQLRMIIDALQKGMAGARADDTKSMKGAVLDWLTTPGVPLNPPLSRNIKADRGFRHDATGFLLCPANMDWKDEETRQQLRNAEYIVPGDQWPVFLYHDYKYDCMDPWKGLFRSRILIKAYKHIFTSPSSVDREPKATKAGNARIHGMEQVTTASIAYVATILRFSLSSSAVFSRTDTVTDSQRFYTSIYDFLEDPEEEEEVAELMIFWNLQIFPEHFSSKRTLTKDSVLSRLKEARAILRARQEKISTT